MLAKDFNKIVILTGAGISAESGLSTFRDSNGLWENHRLEEVATPEAFAADPQLVWRFYSMRRKNALEVEPNTAHKAIDQFINYCKENDKECTLVTQNVDGLHERAATKKYRIHTMHGTLSVTRCDECGHRQADQLSVHHEDHLPECPECNAMTRPDIVWFGEMPKHIDLISQAVIDCDLFVSIGTSGNVYPAAGFIDLAKSYGAKTVCLNMEPLAGNPQIDLYLQGKATETVPKFFKY